MSQRFGKSCALLSALLFIGCVLAASTASAQTNRIHFNNQNIFLNGLNLAWRNFANDFGPNSTIDSAHFNSVFSQVRANGGNCIRVWVHVNGANTPAFSGSTVTGPGTGTISDLQFVLNNATTNHVGVILCLWSFDMLSSSYGSTITTRSHDLLTSATYEGSYITNALIPMVQAVAGHPALVAWEIFNEPEGMSSNFGWTSDRVGMNDIQRFVNHCAGAIHRADPTAKVSNGSWSFYSQTDVGSGNFNYYRDDRLISVGGDTNGVLDFYMVHYYDWAGSTRSPFNTDASFWGLTKPLVVAEFFPGSANGCTNCGTSPYTTLYNRGYAGALAWSWTDSSPSVMLSQIAALYAAHPADVYLTTNQPPVVTLTAPTNNATFAANATVPLTATASDVDGTISKVEFYQGSTKLGQSTNAPYQYNWTNVAQATYQIKAVATDNVGLTTTSSVANITVGTPPSMTRFEAEAAARTGTITVNNSTGASGGQYLYMQADGTITWTIPNVPSAGSYQLTFGYFIPTGFGAKTQTLTVNGGGATSVVFNTPENVWQTRTNTISLNAGSNTITLTKDWGYMYFDYIELPLGSSAPSNTPPVFVSTPANVNIPELSFWSVTNNATDTNLPAQTLTYSLINPPTNAVISSNGVITWTPSEAQGPSTNQIITTVSDGALSVTNSFQVVVTEVNVAPQFTGTPTNVTIPELILWSVTNNATDTDIPAQTLTYQLINPPTNAVINSSGVITWTPSEAQGPSTNQIVTVVSDGALSVTNSFQVVVTEVNVAPQFAGTPTNVTIPELVSWSVTNNATDTDIPAQTLTYQLINPPTNAVINSSGVITWTPSEAQGPSTNQIVTVVSDGALSVTNSFQVVVMPPPPIQIFGVAWLPGVGVRFSFDVPADVPYQIEATDELGGTNPWSSIFSGVGQVGAESFTNNVTGGSGSRFYRIRL